MSPIVLAVLAISAVLVTAPIPATRAPSASRRRVRLPRPGVGTASIAVGLGVLLVTGGVTGAVLGALAALAVRLVVPRLQTEGERRRETLVARQAPLVVDLLAACLASGSALEDAIEAAARAVGTPTREVLVGATTALRLGADPVRVWRDVAALDPLATLARAAARSHESGAPLAVLLPRVAQDVRASARARVEARTRTAAVRLTAPLGLAFLPSFVLLGVVPVVAAWVGSLL